ncbi:glycoside hydrolase family 6 protein [Streptomyces sp. NRRL S-87]|uniref:glycoside hydrolase family 6 protein n=1 Tax=Streptomyces sp. NRRL S-87 TaxID=1463920 RepID=UPI000560C4A9|nr:glycoside hydrolase family 6 protein [Streptomyces sp. NRRL S-87]
MHRRTLAKALAALTLAAVLAPAPWSTAHGTATAALAVHTASDAAAEAGTVLYVPPPNPGAARQARELAGAGLTADAAAVTAMAGTPHAVWLGDPSPARAESQTRTTVLAAARQGALPVLVLHNVPGRDCSQYSAGGATSSAAYRSWVDAVARGIDDHRALVVLEPDSLALLPRECADGGGAQGGTRTAARYSQIEYAVEALEAKPAADVYLDTGHATWHPVTTIVPRLRQAGVARATGFAVNTSNYETDDAGAWFAHLVSACLLYADRGGDPAACPDQWRPRNEAAAWFAARLGTPDPAAMKHFVTDSSRNGQGPWTAPADRYADPQEWCNPPGRGLGARPTTRTGDPLHDARLWIKTPGESDGACLRGTAGPTDPERGTVDPPAGVWFPEQALELVRLARPESARRASS